METPNYYSIIPATVRYDKRLTANAKLLYAEITSLCNMNGKCFATNSYFSKLYQVSKVSVSKWINSLVEFGYIKSDIIYKDGSKEILHRHLSLVNDCIEEKLNTPIKEKFKDNNTSKLDINNTLTESNTSFDEFRIETIKPELDLQFDEFWESYTPVKSSDGRFVAKGNKKACQTKYNKLLKEGITNEEIINGLNQYIEYSRKNGFNTCGAEVFLNQRRFENDYTGSECINGAGARRPEDISYVEIANRAIERARSKNEYDF